MWPWFMWPWFMWPWFMWPWFMWPWFMWPWFMWPWFMWPWFMWPWFMWPWFMWPWFMLLWFMWLWFNLVIGWYCVCARHQVLSATPSVAAIIITLKSNVDTWLVFDMPDNIKTHLWRVWSTNCLDDLGTLDGLFLQSQLFILLLIIIAAKINISARELITCTPETYWACSDTATYLLHVRVISHMSRRSCWYFLTSLFLWSFK